MAQITNQRSTMPSELGVESQLPISIIDAKTQEATTSVFNRNASNSAGAQVENAGRFNPLDFKNATVLETIGKVVFIAGMILVLPFLVLPLILMKIDQRESAGEAALRKQGIMDGAKELLGRSQKGEKNPDGTHKVQTFYQDKGWTENYTRGLTWEDLNHRAETGEWRCPKK